MNIVKFFFTTILGLPNSSVFTSKMPFRRRLTLFGRYFKANGQKLLIRLAIFLFLFKIFLKSVYTDVLLEGVPNLKDFLIFPVVILRFLLQIIFSIF
jgi:hypothetical protein